MRAAVVTIGDEILIGQIIDTNSGYIAKTLDKIGIRVHEMLSVSDDRDHILQTLKLCQNNVDIVIITGGLGPTKDDITKKTLCEYFNDELVVNEGVLAHVTGLIERVQKRPASQANKDQALVPSQCTVLHNEAGTAPGMWMQKENTVFISLPGVPYEMKMIIENELVPKLVAKYERPYILHKTILTYGQGESIVAERIEDWENNLPPYIKLAYLPSPGKVRLRLTARGTDEQLLQDAIDNEVDKLTGLIGDIITGFQESDTIEVVLGRLLTEKNKTISFAESCTGGKIAQAITSVAGASAYFKGAIVPYDTHLKISILGVKKETIDNYSVVSAQVAEEMALCAKKLFNTDYAIAATGNAGPAKGDSNADVGRVFIGFATPEGVYSEDFNFGQPREKVIERTVAKALETIYKEILKN